LRYIHIEHPGPKSHIIVKEGPKPAFSNTQILVQVKATALNRADLMQRQGIYPPPPGESDIPGLELSGIVVAIGSEVKSFKVGDRVYGLVGSGAFAEYCAVDASLARIIPAQWDFVTAAALPEALTTVFGSIFKLGQLRANQTLLVHGAGSGIASLAIQMAKLIGAKVITTVGDNEKIAKAKALGADQVIEYSTQDFDQLIMESSIDVILDFIGGDYFNKHLLLLKTNGRLVQISTLKGHRVECNLSLIIRKRLQINGFILRSQPLAEKAHLWALAHKQWDHYLQEKRLYPIIDTIYPFAQMEDAQEYMDSGKHFGKIVVTI
jgi:NADPH:quinone reductase